ncbi:MarR family transcriptional regulator [Streptomyces axinellae]|jgi:DNA-binding MarR family transcriptional regulator|uniref:HTH marR-type domain-containing protein n=1 Tax=Streptomyces axinellae TaxID=552788 RepID=A0ABP6CT89_9ACTN
MGQWGYERQHDALEVDGADEAHDFDWDEEELRDRIDDHLDRWQPVLPDLDRDVEGSVTRIQLLSDHLRWVREKSLTEIGLHRHEYDTLHALVGRDGSATDVYLASDMGLPPSSLTGRLDGLEERGYVRCASSDVDPESVEVTLTDEGHAAWLAAIDAVGHEEYRLLSSLDSDERRLIAGLLRRMMLKAEEYDAE